MGYRTHRRHFRYFEKNIITFSITAPSLGLSFHISPSRLKIELAIYYPLLYKYTCSSNNLDYLISFKTDFYICLDLER